MYKQLRDPNFGLSLRDTDTRLLSIILAICTKLMQLFISALYFDQSTRQRSIHNYNDQCRKHDQSFKLRYHTEDRRCTAHVDLSRLVHGKLWTVHKVPTYYKGVKETGASFGDFASVSLLSPFYFLRFPVIYD